MLFKLLKIFLAGILCSLPIYIGAFMTVSDGAILFLSFIAFAVIICIDTYQFSLTFWKMKEYLLGQLLPLGIYCIAGFLTCLIFKPYVFNRIFLPLRFAGGFGLSTKRSIVVISLLIIVIVTIVWLIGSRAGRRIYEMYVRDDEEI